MIGQVFWTVLSGVTVFVLGQVFVKFVIDPIQAFYKVTGEVGHSLIYYANVYSNTKMCEKPELQEAHEAFRRLSCQLFLNAYAIPWYGFWARLRFLPPYWEVQEAGGHLIGLSNGCLDKSDMACQRNEIHKRTLEHLLRLKTGG
jgi:hypothetical protein